MSATIRYCRNCGCQTRHLHLHDVTAGQGKETHLTGSERFACAPCGLLTFAYTEGCDRFRFVLDGIERQNVFSHAGARR